MRISASTAWAVSLCAAVHLAACSMIRAEDPPSEVRVARLIRNLGSDSFSERERASAELRSLGAAMRRQLEEAAQSEDAEVRAHAASLIKQLRLADLWAPGLVSCRTDGDPAAKVLTSLAEQTGNRLLIGDQYGTFHDAPVALDHADAPFWKVLDDVCRQTGNQVRHHYDTRTPGLVVVQGEPGKFPVAYAGPVRAQITSARRVFIEEMNYQDLKSEITHTFQFNLQMMWEDRFRLVAYRSQPDLVQALAEDGAELAAAQPSGSGWNVAGAGTLQLAMNLRMQPPSTAAHTLDTLRLVWGLIAVGDMQTLEVSDLSSVAPHYQDDVELIIESVQERPGARYEVSVVVSRDLIIPQPQEVLFQENDFDLFDAEGRAFRKQGQTNSLADQGARIRFTFAGETPASVPKVLRLTYPRLRAQHDLEITFRDVPLPVGKPE
jgi:hypothetical protein